MTFKELIKVGLTKIFTEPPSPALSYKQLVDEMPFEGDTVKIVLSEDNMKKWFGSKGTS